MSTSLVAGSSHSGGSKKEGKGEKGERKSASPMGSGSESDAASLVSSRQMGPPGAPHPGMGPPGMGPPPQYPMGMPGAPLQPGQPLPLGAMPPDLSGSRQSFRMAMGNPCEFFVDVM